jgi:hypothetical protein
VRAVYFELDVNCLSLTVARDYGSFVPLGWASFERLLPDLAAWLTVEELQTVASAYLGHAGYGRPPAIRRYHARVGDRSSMRSCSRIGAPSSWSRDGLFETRD